MAGVTITPQLIVSLATLITAITALVRALMTHETVKQTASDVAQVKEQTNGTVEDLHRQIDALRATQATPQELAARPPTTADAPSKGESNGNPPHGTTTR